MKCIVSTACVLSVLVAVSFAAPYFPAQFSATSNLQIGGSAPGTATNSSTPGGSITDILGQIDIPALLRSVNSIVKLVGVFCPPCSQILDNVIQNVTSVAFRVFGRAILRNGLGGGGGGSSGGGASRVNVVLPTYPPDEDEDYDDEDSDSTPAPGSDDNVDLRIAQSSSTATSTSTTTTTENTESAVNTTSTLYTSPVNDADNTVAKRHVRVIREANAEEEEEEDDQDGAESAPQPSEDLSNVDEDDTDRNKRYLPFGGTVSGHGSTGGSGNFLFDIIRLIAGSGATEESDEKVNGPGGVAEVDIAKGISTGHNGEGIPGPITRLFVVANRGLANLVQDLILRLAATSERIVNFKARLVTSLI